MKNGFYFGFIFLIALLGACSPVRVFLEKDEVSAVKDYKTFMVISEYPGKNAYGSPELEESLQRQLIEVMEEKGYELDINDPDLIVRYNTILSQNQKEINTMAHNPWGWGMYNPWMWRTPYSYRSGSGGYQTEKYNLGEVVLDFIDTQKDEAILRISAVGEVTKEKQKTKNIRVSVDRIIKEFSKQING
ncbi:MAG: DUF4136 domain-containing protein [Anditalea sp.]